GEAGALLVQSQGTASEMQRTSRYETTCICAFAHGRRARRRHRRLALVRCFCPAAVPDPARVGARGDPAGNPRARRLPPPDGAPRHRRLQRARPRRATPRLLAPAHDPPGLRRRAGRAAAGPAAPEPALVRQGDEPVDPAARRRGQRRPGDHPRPRQRRDGPRHLSAAGRPLEAGQALDHQPRPGVRAQKGARDRLIRLLQRHPAWALGFGDETWWSRFACPAVHAWAEGDEPLRLIEQTRPTDDPDPKALACYGLLVRRATDDPDRVWLRLVDGRPVSVLTTAFLGWCCHKLEEAGVPVLLLVWDNASWHISRAVRAWLRDHNRRAKREGKGVR